MDKKIIIWKYDPSSYKYYPDQRIEDHHEAVYSVAYSDDDSLLMSGSFDKTVKIRKFSEQRQNYEHSQTLFGHGGTVFGVRATSKNTYILSCSYDKTVIVWHLEGLKYRKF